MYAGGLDTREDSDGHYTIHWRSVSTQVRTELLLSNSVARSSKRRKGETVRVVSQKLTRSVVCVCGRVPCAVCIRWCTMW
jgi:hypothetical protein